MKKLFTPLSQEIQDSLSKLLSSNTKLSLYVSGGCSSILGWLTLLPGSSKNVAETHNPYNKGALCSLLGYEPSKFVDFSVSRDLAIKAFTNTQKYMYLEADNNLHFQQERILGVGISGALRSNYERRGLHHVHVSLVDQKKYISYYIVLDRDQRIREEQDSFVSYNVLNLINTPFTDNPTLTGEVFENDKIEVSESSDTIDLLLPALDKRIMNIIFLPEGRLLVDQVLNKCIVIPGSFNPVHDGHVAMGKAVAERFGLKESDVIFELSAMNADKGLIAKEEIEKRVKMIVDKGFGAMLTHKPFFYAKNEYLRNGYFVVGADTYKRIINTKYYENSDAVMTSKLAEFEKYKNSMIVAARLNNETMKVETLGDFDIPEVLKAWIHELKEFRADVSSTEIRKKLEEKDAQSDKPSTFFE